MTETTARLRWQTLSNGDALGYVTPGQWLYEICKPSDDAGDDELELRSRLPGQTGDRWQGKDRAELEGEAEEMLAGFVTSLGAIFPGALRSEVATMRDDKHQLAADHEESGHDWQTERCYGAVEALDWMLATIDRMTAPPANPSPAGEE